MNPKISWLTIKVHWFEITNFINFYNELVNVVNKIPNTKILVILGDLKTRFRKEIAFNIVDLRIYPCLSMFSRSFGSISSDIIKGLYFLC